MGYSNIIRTSNVASSTFFYFCRVPYSGAIVSVIATIQIAAKSNNHDCFYCCGVVFVSSSLDKLLYVLSACMLFASLFLCNVVLVVVMMVVAVSAIVDVGRYFGPDVPYVIIFRLLLVIH